MRRTQDEVWEDLADLRKQLSRPKTMSELTYYFDVNRTTIYRWFRLLKQEGWSVQREGVSRPTKFYLN